MTDFFDIQQLVKLFNPPREDDDSDSDCNDSNQTPTFNNANVEEKPQEPKPNPYSKVETERQEKLVTDICDEDSCETASDWKKTPKFDISYRQKVTASDVFLQVFYETNNSYVLCK